MIEENVTLSIKTQTAVVQVQQHVEGTRSNDTMHVQGLGRVWVGHITS